MIILLLIAYMTGSFPTALLAGYLLKGRDIRKEGSGNAGATNVFRVLGPAAAAPVMLIDFLKACLPVYYSDELALFAGLSSPGGDLLKILILIAVVLGHVFPLWAGFKGGKGVACAAGGISALFPPAVPFCLLVFFLTALVTRYVSLASLLTAWTLPLYYLIYWKIADIPFSVVLLVFFVFIALGITVLHRKNLGRLIRGEENRLGSRDHRI